MDITAQNAKQIASSYVSPVETIDTVMQVVMQKIHKAAEHGLFEVKLSCIPLTSVVKEELKKRGFKVSVYHVFDEYTKQKVLSGDIEISWRD